MQAINHISYWDARIQQKEPSEDYYKEKVNKLFSLNRKQLEQAKGLEWLQNQIKIQVNPYEKEIQGKFNIIKKTLGSKLIDQAYKIKYLIIRLTHAGLWEKFAKSLDEFQQIQKEAADTTGKINWTTYGSAERQNELDALSRWDQFETDLALSLIQFEQTQKALCRDEEKAKEFQLLTLKITELQNLELLNAAKHLVIKQALTSLTSQENKFLKEFNHTSLPTLKQALEEAEKLANENDEQLKNSRALSDLECRRRKVARMTFSLKLLESQIDIVEKEKKAPEGSSGAPSILPLKEEIKMPPGFENLQSVFFDPIKQQKSQVGSQLTMCLTEIEILSNEQENSHYLKEFRALVKTVVESCFPYSTQILIDILALSITNKTQFSGPADRLIKGQAHSKKIASEQPESIKRLYEFGFQERHGLFLLNRTEWAIEAINERTNFPKIISYYLSVARPNGKCAQLKLGLDLSELKIENERDQNFVANFITEYVDKPFNEKHKETENEFIARNRKNSRLSVDKFALLAEKAKSFKEKFELGLLKIFMLVNNPKVNLEKVDSIQDIQIISRHEFDEMSSTLNRLTDKVMDIMFRLRRAFIIPYYRGQLNDMIRPLVESRQIKEFEQFLDLCKITREYTYKLVEEREDRKVDSAADEALHNFETLNESYCACVTKQPVYPHLNLIPLLNALMGTCFPMGLEWIPNMFSLAYNPNPSPDQNAYVSYIAPKIALAQNISNHPYHEQAFIDAKIGFIKTSLFRWHQALWEESKEAPGLWTLTLAAAIPGYHCIEDYVNLDLRIFSPLTPEKTRKIFEYVEEECGMAGSASKRRMTIDLSDKAVGKRKESLQELKVNLAQLSEIAKTFSAKFQRTLNILSTRLGDPLRCDYTHVNITGKMIENSSKLALKDLLQEGWKTESLFAEDRKFQKEVQDKLLRDPEALRYLYYLLQDIKISRNKIENELNEFIVININPKLTSLITYLDEKGFSKQHFPLLTQRLCEMIYNHVTGRDKPVQANKSARYSTDEESL